MKLNSFYDKKLPVSTKASSPMFVTNEVKEQELMQEITVLEAQIKQYEESIIEHDKIQRLSKALKEENYDVVFRLEQTEEALRNREADLETFEDLEKANKSYKERIGELESSNKALSITLSEAQENSKKLNYEMGLIRNQNKDYQEKIETWNLRVDEAEGIIIGLEDDKQTLDEAKRRADEERSKAVSQVSDRKKTIEQLDNERNFWKVSSESYEEQMNELGRVEDQLRTWTGKLEDKLGTGQSNSKKDKTKITKLNNTIKEMARVLEDLTDHNNYLIDFNAALKVELSRPKYVSAGSVQGEKFPLARENIRTKQLGTGKPTLLKFRPKGDENDND